MNILFITNFVSVFGHCPYLVTFPYRVNKGLKVKG